MHLYVFALNAFWEEILSSAVSNSSLSSELTKNGFMPPTYSINNFSFLCLIMHEYLTILGL